LHNLPKYKIQKFSDSESEIWDAFVMSSINGTFLHLRNFINQHKERFSEDSLMITSEDGGLVAVLPLVIEGEIGHSHPGLTYGGLVHRGINAIETIDVFAEICRYLSNKGISKLIYRAIPYIYHKDHSDEDLYALWYLGGTLISRSASSVISPHSFRPRKNRRIRGLKQAVKMNVKIQYEEISESYWRILSQNLEEKYSKAPVHNLSEIVELEQNFPKNIKLVTARIEGEIVGGIVIFETSQVVHLQYIASNSKGRLSNALDALIDFLLLDFKGKIIDFGVSTEFNGKKLNLGLHQFKSEFGSGVINYEIYELSTSNIFTGL